MSDSELLSEEEILALVEMGEKEGVEAYNLASDAEDYDIKIPKIVRDNIASFIEITIHATLSPRWCKPFQK